jgi:hypothetical protein
MTMLLDNSRVDDDPQLYQRFLVAPHGGDSGSSSGSSSGSGSGSGSSSGSGSGSSGGSTSGGSTSSSSSSSSASSSGSNSGSSSGGASGFVKNLMNGGEGNNSGSLRLAALIAAGIIALLVLIAIFVVVMIRRRRRKKNNRGDKALLDQDEKVQLDCELATVSSSTQDDCELAAVPVPSPSLPSPSLQPTSGVYYTKSLKEDLETELDLSFETVPAGGAAMDVGGFIDSGEHYKLSGTGFQKCDEDSHVGYVRITIADGYVSLDGSTAWWIEERTPFIDNLHNKGATCPRPRCSKKNGNNNNCWSPGTGVAPPAIETKFSTDGETIQRVECRGMFDYENRTFQGAWTQKTSKQHRQEGVYNLCLKQEEENANDDTESEKQKPMVKQLKKGLLSLFGHNKR